MSKPKESLVIQNEDGSVTDLNAIPCVDEPCMKCGKMPPVQGERWYSFTERDGKMVGVYTCDECMEASGSPTQ